MSEYRQDHSIVDDALLTPRQAVQIWRVIPEDLRYRFVLTLPEALADQVVALTAKHTDAAPVPPPGRAADRQVPPRGGRADVPTRAATTAALSGDQEDYSMTTGVSTR